MTISLARPTWRFSRRTWLRWILAPALAGVFLGATIDPSALAGSGTERLTAVFLIDGSSYFGQAEDLPWSDTVTLRDVYYFQSADPSNAESGVVLVRRGTELHAPSDGMRIRRDQILGVERMRLDSPVAKSIAVDRFITAQQASR